MRRVASLVSIIALAFSIQTVLAASVSAATLVGLRGRNPAELDALLAAQQDPSSSDYQRWLTSREFGRRFGAPPKDMKRVERWLRDDGCRIKRSVGRQQVECLGGNPSSPPTALAPLVDGVVDLDAPVEIEHHLGLGELLPRSVDPEGKFYFTPQEYAGFYGFAALQTSGITGAGQQIGIVGTVPVDPADIALFRSTFGLPPLILDQIGTPGSNTDDRDLVEALLDVSWSGAVAPGAAVTLHITKGSVVDSIKYLVERPDIFIISISLNPVPNKQNQPLIKQSLQLFKQAAAQGKSVLIASGDFGPLAISSPPKRGVDPYAQSPFVTGVGGTSPSATVGAFVYGKEVVWQDGKAASGGGKSPLARPKYQKGLKGTGGKRAVPDVSLAASAVYPIAKGGAVICCVAGTSAAAPVWAGLTAMLNQQKGRSAGLLNPTLYDVGNAQTKGGAAVFHDITEGSSTTSQARGFPAKPGYDLATGWGSPRVPELFAAFP